MAFLLWLERLPRLHGKAHGRNRRNATGAAPDKLSEIATADAADAAIRAEIESRKGLSLGEKRAALARALKPRLNDEAIAKHHARIKAIFDAAREDLGWTGADFVSVLPEYRRRSTQARNRAEDPLALRVTCSKKRSAWSDERVVALLTSPLYAGSASRARRWKPGDLMVRDAMYWAPLICRFSAARPEEVLQRLKSDVQMRDGVACLRIEERADARVKNAASERFVPFPQVLLDLGFPQWWRERLDEPGLLLFPEVPAGVHSGRISDVFGKRRLTLFRHLGVADPGEDFYALRKTCLSALLLAGTPDAVRQAIAGHEHDQIINRHYTETNLRLIKSWLDRVKHGLTIAQHPRHGFPVITDCCFGSLPAIELRVTLDAQDRLKRLEAIDPASEHRELLVVEPAALSRADGGVTAPPAVLKRLRALTFERRLRLLGEVDEAHERAVGMLLAIAEVEAAATPGDQGAKAAA